ncbi:heme utilization protein [Pseudomonas eucalypticola]|uniref:Heme utilization protein n=1 Tax=Pseudomonas eucalypticola TaxID=2599595 RepID=A0A7D5H1H2_9PSED|nr:heme utilization protein [Pseudomonas eucalypticola]QKZ05445.1 heme utilization protein [Pseudomonas eucalypticola]
MKPALALKPLVFALAAVMAVAAHAGDDRNQGGHGDPHHGGHQQQPDPMLQIQLTAGAAAVVSDAQHSSGNAVLNEGTKNSATIDSSAANSNGNLGVNVAGGDANQQDNAAAIATADESFIFGSAYAQTTATQSNTSNTVANYSTTAKTSLTGTANGSSGNIGINVTSGDYNQQKNNLAIAVSGGRVAGASASADQTSSGNTVGNVADRTYSKDTLYATYHATGSYKGTGTGTVGGNDSHSGQDNRGGHQSSSQPLAFKESGSVELNGVASYQVLTPTGWANPVNNSASVSNSLNNVSGNVGANVSAGVGNQQSNSLSIAAGCKACM